MRWEISGDPREGQPRCQLEGLAASKQPMLQHSHFLMAHFNLLIELQHHSQHGVKSPAWLKKGWAEQPGLENPNTSSRVSSTQP